MTNTDASSSDTAGVDFFIAPPLSIKKSMKTGFDYVALEASIRGLLPAVVLESDFYFKITFSEKFDLNTIARGPPA